MLQPPVCPVGKGESRMNEVHAPYNFIPFSERVLIRYEKLEELPPHDKIVPGLKTGEIHLTLTAKTPVFVSDGAAEHPHFFRGANGRHQIPGSAVRGMVRTNLQVLGFGHVRPGEDINESLQMERGLPARHRELVKRDLVLDYPHAMLGFISKKSEGEAYASRVSFGDFEVKENIREKTECRILRMPHPERCKFYVADGDSYKAKIYRLRGRKLYWMKEVSGRSVRSRAATEMHPLAVGTKFKGVIRYKNLAEDELGLLLWALRLEPGCFQSIGRGKPYGFGRVEPLLTELREFEPDKMYNPESFFAEPYTIRCGRGLETAIEHYIGCYEARVMRGAAAGARLRDCRELQDFFFMHKLQDKMPKEEMEYIQRSETKTRNRPMKTVEEYRRPQR